MRTSIVSIAVSLCMVALALGAPVAAPDFLLRWGSKGTAPGQFINPAGLALDADGNVYVADVYNSRIQKFSPQGQLLGVIGSTGSGIGQLLWPRDVEIGPDGNVYVSDTENNRVQVFAQNGSWIRTIGEYGGGPGQMNEPWGIAVDPSGNIYVMDGSSSRVEKFDDQGNMLLSWDLSSTASDIEVGPDGNVYLMDSGRMKRYTTTGSLINSWSARGDGYDTRVEYLAIASDGHVWVTDSYAVNKVMEFTPTGALLSKWGNVGSGDGQFYMPTGIQVDSQGNIYVAQSLDSPVTGYGPQDIQKFGSVPTPVRQMRWGELKTKYR